MYMKDNITQNNTSIYIMTVAPFSSVKNNDEYISSLLKAKSSPGLS